jgi:Sec-independent protein secretion pathway component TatC
MPIRKWHVGRIALLWAWGIVLSIVLIQIISKTTNFVLGFILIATLLAILITLSIITWKWFGDVGEQESDKPKSKKLPDERVPGL